MAKSLHDTATEQYALIHRAVENGEANDALWQSMVNVCIDLDKKDEAIHALDQISDAGLRRSLRRQLAHRGWHTKAREEETAQVTVTDADMNPSTREKLEDSLRFLFDGRTAWALLVGTVAFPVLLALGGIVTAASDGIGPRVIAAVPVLVLLGMVGAFGRHILILSTHAVDDGADLPEPLQLLRETPAFLLDFAALAGLFLLPGSALMVLGQPWIALPLFAPAALLLPMATALRLACRDWRALSFRPLWAAVRSCPSYLRVAGVTTLLFAPAMVAMWLTLGRPAFLVVSVMGPLSVGPFFVAMRMLGLMLYYERAGVEHLFQLPADPRAPVISHHGWHAHEHGEDQGEDRDGGSAHGEPPVAEAPPAPQVRRTHAAEQTRREQPAQHTQQTQRTQQARQTQPAQQTQPAKAPPRQGQGGKAGQAGTPTGNWYDSHPKGTPRPAPRDAGGPGGGPSRRPN